MPQIRHWSYRLKHSNLDELVNMLPSLENTDSDYLFLVVPLEGGINLSLLVKLFVVSYFLGMLVRYYPTHWLALQNRQKGDFMLPMVREVVNLIDSQFLALLLGELDGEEPGLRFAHDGMRVLLQRSLDQTGWAMVEPSNKAGGCSSC